ncbi:MAG: flagellar protein FlgN [Solirubrobacteraceae bacterium]|nr:flagellar protein FlgN [Solirubrobacteraceae bacterium]
MSTTMTVHLGMGQELLSHLEDQVRSAERLLDTVLRQGVAIRDRQVEKVIGAIGEIQTEMERRAQLEQRRNVVLARAGEQLGMPAHAVTLDHICTLLDPVTATTARERSAQLRGLLAEIQKKHTINRALMRQELAFLDHLTRLLGGEEDTGAYGPSATANAVDPTAGRFAAGAAHRVLDLEA